MTAHQIVSAIEQHLPADFTDREREEARTLLNLVYDCITDEEHPDAGRTKLAGMTDYGCWVGEVREALADAYQEFADKPERSTLLLMAGGLSVAGAWLFDVHRSTEQAARQKDLERRQMATIHDLMAERQGMQP